MDVTKEREEMHSSVVSQMANESIGYISIEATHKYVDVAVYSMQDAQRAADALRAMGMDVSDRPADLSDIGEEGFNVTAYTR